MKKQPLYAALPAIVLSVFLFSGCIKPGPVHFPDNAAKFCNIKTISFSFAESPNPDTFTILYNSLGNPVHTHHKFVGTGSPDYLFRYDQQGRLQDFIGVYGNDNGAEFWTRFTYSPVDRTVYDTTFSLLGDIVNWPPTDFDGDVRSDIRKYDGEGRIIEITSFRFENFGTGQVQSVPTPGGIFSYDAQGNAVPGGPYDDKINYHRTNKVWMFIDNQFSVNNPLPIDQYNVFGLPVKFTFDGNKFPEPPYHPILFQVGSGQTGISYDCDLPHGK